MKFNTITALRTIVILLASALIVTSCKKDKLISPGITKIDPEQGSGNEVLTLTGSGLLNIRSIVFDLGNVPAAVNPNFNTDNAVIFRVPTNANVGDQHIVITNAAGYQFSVPFRVLALPSITSAFPAEWEAGNKITLTGNYLDGVDEVSIEGSTIKATIVSKTAKTLVITIPAADVSTARLIIHNTAGSTTTNMIFTNMDKQFKLFTEDLASGMQNWSWSAASVSSDFAVSGTKSMKSVFSAGGYQGLSFHYDFDINFGDYQTLSFWVKGGIDDNEIKISPDGVASGSPASTTIKVPSTVWTHFNVPLTNNSSVKASRVNFQITGPASFTETLYFDNIYLAK